MMKNFKITGLSLIGTFLIIVCFSNVQAQPQSQSQPAREAQPLPPPPPPLPPPDPMGGLDLNSKPIERLTPGVFKIGEITMNKDTQAITFPALVNMDKGLLEYLIVQSRGKTHESLLRTKVEPYHLQIAFLLLGFEGSDRPLLFQGDPEKPKGDPVEITFNFHNKEGKPTTIKADEWVVKGGEAGLKEAGRMEWVYTGSMVRDNRFQAQIEASIAAIFHDPAAMIDNGSEGGESDKIWFVKEGTVPPVGTPVIVTIKKKSRK